MTDTTTSTTTAAVDDVRARDKNLIFVALAEAGIAKISIEFDGAGDSGQIDDVLAWNYAGDTIPLPSDRKVQIPSPVPGDLPAEMTFQDAVETLAYDYLEDTHPGWEINDGAFGTFVFDVPDRSITLDYRERFTEVDTTTHEF